jgi:hypothetical protein
MKRSLDLRSALLGAAVTLAIVVAMGAASPSDEGKPWEYKIISGDVLALEHRLDSRIAEQQKEGWEFVSASGLGQQNGIAVLRRVRVE